MARIFVVNDEADLLDLVGMVLEAAGHEVVTRTISSDVVREVEERRPDLVLIDLIMPGMTGDQVIAELRARPLDVRILAMSALVDGRARAMRAGADAFLPKPFDADAVVRYVDDTLKRKPRERSARA